MLSSALALFIVALIAMCLGYWGFAGLASMSKDSVQGVDRSHSRSERRR
jgi:hypothetical protein